MKRHLVKTTILLLGLTMGLRADESPNKMTEDRMRAFEEEILQISWSRIHTPLKTQLLREYAVSNNIPEGIFVSTVEKVAEDLIADTVVYKDFHGKNAVGIRNWEKLANLIIIMGRLGDPEFLPWLERQAMESENSGVREFASIAFVKIAGLDAIPFVQKVLTGSREKYDFHCRNLVSKEFFDQIGKAEAAKAPQEKIDAAYAMLIEQVLNEQKEDIAWELDKRLSLQLPEYNASRQRNVVLSHLLQSTNEAAKGLFIQRYNEFQKTPKADRTDLRTRFPGLAVPKTGQGTRLESSSEQEIAE